MPVLEQSDNKATIKAAIKAVLAEKHLTHHVIAEKLGLSDSTVSNKLSKCDFSERDAARWSKALGIPAEIFLYVQEADKQPDLYALYRELKQEVDELKAKVDNLSR